MAPRKKKKPFDLKRRASSLRSSLRRRCDLNTPTTQELYVWLEESQPFRCYYFGEDVKPTELHVDHKQPVTLGGDNSLENLCITSSRVNRAKGQFEEKEFKGLVAFCKRFPKAKNYLITRLLVGARVGRR